MNGNVDVTINEIIFVSLNTDSKYGHLCTWVVNFMFADGLNPHSRCVFDGVNMVIDGDKCIFIVGALSWNLKDLRSFKDKFIFVCILNLSYSILLKLVFRFVW